MGRAVVMGQGGSVMFRRVLNHLPVVVVTVLLPAMVMAGPGGIQRASQEDWWRSIFLTGYATLLRASQHHA